MKAAAAKPLTFAVAFLLLPVLIAEDRPDPVLECTRKYVITWLAGIPDFVGRQSTNQFVSNYRHAWRADRAMDSELTVERHMERYQLLSLDEKPLDVPTPIDIDVLGSRGEFLSAIRVLFDPKSHASFKSAGVDHKEGRSLHRYRFSISKANSQWYVGVDPSYTPPYDGIILVDPQDGAIYRLEMNALRFPETSNIKEISLQLDFAPVTIDEASYILPSKAVITLCTNRAYCERRKITFSDYQRFTVKSRLSYGADVR